MGTRGRATGLAARLAQAQPRGIPRYTAQQQRPRLNAECGDALESLYPRPRAFWVTFWLASNLPLSSWPRPAICQTSTEEELAQPVP